MCLEGRRNGKEAAATLRPEGHNWEGRARVEQQAQGWPGSPNTWSRCPAMASHINRRKPMWSVRVPWPRTGGLRNEKLPRLGLGLSSCTRAPTPLGFLGSGNRSSSRSESRSCLGAKFCSSVLEARSIGHSSLEPPSTPARPVRRRDVAASGQGSCHRARLRPEGRVAGPPPTSGSRLAAQHRRTPVRADGSGLLRTHVEGTAGPSGGPHAGRTLRASPARCGGTLCQERAHSGSSRAQ